MQLPRFLAALLGLSVASCSNAENIAWPDLPNTGFVTGRVATVEDAKQDNAVFSMNGKSLGPIKVDIPQYVFWKDDKGNKHPMILVQAEHAPDGTDIVGLRSFEGNATAATLPELELLGTKKPAQ